MKSGPDPPWLSLAHPQVLSEETCSLQQALEALLQELLKEQAGLLVGVQDLCGLVKELLQRTGLCSEACCKAGLWERRESWEEPRNEEGRFVAEKGEKWDLGGWGEGGEMERLGQVCRNEAVYVGVWRVGGFWLFLFCG